MTIVLGIVLFISLLSNWFQFWYHKGWSEAAVEAVALLRKGGK